MGETDEDLYFYSLVLSSCQCSLAGFLGNSRGLYRGDSLSFLLFLLVMEVFSQLLKRVEEGGIWCGFQAGSHVQGGLNIYHILFTDDTILFCDASKEQLYTYIYGWC